MPAPRPRKSLGQHFLITSAVITRLVEVIAPNPDDTIIEIGPGRGALTALLAASGARVVAVEFDIVLAKRLQNEFAASNSVTIIRQDFLTYNPAREKIEKFKLVGNIPYNITSPVMEWLNKRRADIVSVVLMVQKELGARIAGRPGGKDWSPLSIFTQIHFDVEKVFDVAPTEFRPAPKVWSSVIKLMPHKRFTIEYPAAFEKVVRTAFHHRRKLLINNLTPDIFRDAGEARSLMIDLGFSPKARAEELSIEQFMTLTDRLRRNKLIL